jgi:hypothetical protein
VPRPGRQPRPARPAAAAAAARGRPLARAGPRGRPDVGHAHAWRPRRRRRGGGAAQRRRARRGRFAGAGQALPCHREWPGGWAFGGGGLIREARSRSCCPGTCCCFRTLHQPPNPFPQTPQVHTSDLRGAGTDAGVWVELFGASGRRSGRVPLDDSPARSNVSGPGVGGGPPGSPLPTAAAAQRSIAPHLLAACPCHDIARSLLNPPPQNPPPGSSPAARAPSSPSSCPTWAPSTPWPSATTARGSPRTGTWRAWRWWRRARGGAGASPAAGARRAGGAGGGPGFGLCEDVCGAAFPTVRLAIATACASKLPAQTRPPRPAPAGGSSPTARRAP